MRGLSSLAIIPARGGSKRIPHKNVRNFAGKPIIVWSIETALRSSLFDIVMVSTDDADIAVLARQHGAQTPFLRSASTSNDTATLSDALREVLLEFGAVGRQFDTVCCLFATAPFVTPSALSLGKKLLDEGDFDVVLPVVEFAYPIWRGLKRDASGNINLLFPEFESSRSQDLCSTYHDAGQWIWFRSEPFLKGQPLLGPRTGSVLISAASAQDIDTEEDWELAEMKFGALANRSRENP